MILLIIVLVLVFGLGGGASETASSSENVLPIIEPQTLCRSIFQGLVWSDK